jgi:hypothetical protein
MRGAGDNRSVIIICTLLVSWSSTRSSVQRTLKTADEGSERADLEWFSSSVLQKAITNPTEEDREKITIHTIKYLCLQLSEGFIYIYIFRDAKKTDSDIIGRTYLCAAVSLCHYIYIYKGTFKHTPKSLESPVTTCCWRVNTILESSLTIIQHAICWEIIRYIFLSIVFYTNAFILNYSYLSYVKYSANGNIILKSFTGN